MRTAGVTAVVAATVLAACTNAAVPPSTMSPATTGPLETSTTSTTRVLDPRPGAPGIGDPLYPDLGNGGYDVTHYDIDLRLLPDGSIMGRTAVSAVALQDLSGLDLDLVGMTVTGVDSAPDRGPVQDCAGTSGFERRGRELVVTFPAPVADGDTFRVTVCYRGVPGTVGRGAVPFAPGWEQADGISYAFDEPDGAAAWFPSNDHPADKATVRLSVTAPADTTVVSGGAVATPVGRDGLVTHTFVYEHPVATYLVPLAVGSLSSRLDGSLPDGTPIVTWFPRNATPSLLFPLTRQADIVGFFVQRFGAFPFGSLGALVVPDDNLRAALETQTMITYTTPILSLGDEVVAHEIAHQWFGDAVSVAHWGDIWLNEGFATFAQWLWVEHRDGTALYDRRVADAYDLISGQSLVSPSVSPSQADARARQAYPPPAMPRSDDLFSASVYQRGGLTLVALRDLIGDDAMFRLLTTWVDRHRDGNASTADFVGLVGEMAGAGARQLVESWLTTPRIPAMPERGLEPPG